MQSTYITTTKRRFPRLLADCFGWRQGNRTEQTSGPHAKHNPLLILWVWCELYHKYDGREDKIL